ncbi:hypothetical protein H0H81_002398 [Sphagnurus paluster]|uniref:CCHC-type domain-containing protein n=1 Tax=Sphagnurus paluster TaxID=117069 RepID=A0A9P7GFM1_9AGAR|nr:hypothetical protein H0H81_002398 [Sphagnurus paluster]
MNWSTQPRINGQWVARPTEPTPPVTPGSTPFLTPTSTPDTSPSNLPEPSFAQQPSQNTPSSNLPWPPLPPSPPVRTIMSTHQIQPMKNFTGELKDGVQPENFLKEFRKYIRACALTSDAKKISAFGDFLETDSVADEWFKYAATPKTNWNTFESVFSTKFPGIKKAARTTMELEREFQGMRLKVKDLATMETYGGVEVWTHVAFAEKVLDLARRAKIDTVTSYIFMVHDNLPEIIKDKVSESHANWNAFCTAIKDIDLTHIRDGKRKFEEKRAEAEKLENQIHRLEQQLSRSNISTATQPRAPRPTNSLSITPTPSTNPSPIPHQPLLPVTEEMWTAARARIAEFPQQPDTPEGNAAYREQCHAWLRTFSASHTPNEKTGFPLKPGTAGLCSGECYLCGKVGHNHSACMAPASEMIVKKESDWQAFCARVLGRWGQEPVPSYNADMIDLYSVVHGSTLQERPFFHQLTISKGKNCIPVRALFDGGAMVGAMCAKVFERIKGCLRNWRPLSTNLQMANGTIVQSKAYWKGHMTIDTMNIEGEFEVFDSQGGWEFLLGKPILRKFNAVHDFRSDQVILRPHAPAQHIVLQNEATAINGKDRVISGNHGEQIEGGSSGMNPPVRQVNNVTETPNIEQVDQPEVPVAIKTEDIEEICIMVGEYQESLGLDEAIHEDAMGGNIPP